jgi:biopolymer transport protein ExbD
MRRFSDRHALTTLTELNVTPLLDLAFVLLIIFMITTPLMENSVDLVVPSSEAAKNAINPSAVQTVSLDREERLEFNGEATTREELGALLLALHEANPEVAVVVRAHRDLAVQKLIELIDVVKGARITKIGVVTTPDEP